MKISELRLPEHIYFCAFESRSALTNSLSELIQMRLKNAIRQSGSASLAVSGGSTPIPLFDQLSNTPLDWSKVAVTLVDDRWVNPEQPDSNELLVKKHLLHNAAENARFIGLWQPEISAEAAVVNCHQRLSALNDRLDTVILGMGNDGHTASLFPCSNELEAALNSDLDCAAVNPGTAPHARMTLTPKRLLNSELRILHLCGQDKLETLAKALKDNDPQTMPISLFLQHPLTIYWAP
ncbi:MAG: 6-phosphogluconolactonase [Amphritea sp.]